MNVLIVVATYQEVQPLLDFMNIHDDKIDAFKVYPFGGHKFTILLSNIGMVCTSLIVSRILGMADGKFKFDLAINAGICGCFDKTITLGNVLNVSDDVFSELGAEDGDNFIPIEKMNFGIPVRVINSEYNFENIIIESLPKVNGITVNTVHGNKDSIERVVKMFNPTVESMEGAAFMLCCDFYQINYVQIRAVSNYVEVRNKDAWNIPLAIKNLNNTLINILETL